jgi:hypothetical protein
VTIPETRYLESKLNATLSAEANVAARRVPKCLLSSLFEALLVLVPSPSEERRLTAFNRWR